MFVLSQPRSLRANRRGIPACGERVERKRRQGGTLLEVVLALGLGTFVVLSACQMIVTTTVSSVSARQNTLAYNAARAVLENIRLYQGAVLTSGTCADARSFGPVPQLAVLPGGAVSAVIGTYRSTPTYSVKIVTITVSWSGTRTDHSSGMRKTRKITALVAPKGVTP